MPRATVFARLAPLVVALAPVVLGQGVTGRGGRQDRSTGTASGENSEYVHAHWLPPTPCVVAHTGALPATSVVAVALLSTVVALILLTYCFNRFCRSRASGGAYLSRVVPGEHSQRTLAVPAAVSRFRAEYLVQTAPMQPKDIPLGKPLFSVCPYEVYRASPAGNPENVAKLSDEGHRIEFDGPDDAVATAQAQTPLALELNHSQRVYWEVRIDAFENAKDRAMRRKDEAHQQRKALVKDGFQMLKKRGSSFFGRSVVAKNDGELAGASVSIGWATHLYPVRHAPLAHDLQLWSYSIVMFVCGCTVVSTRGRRGFQCWTAIGRNFDHVDDFRWAGRRARRCGPDDRAVPRRRRDWMRHGTSRIAAGAQVRPSSRRA